MEFKYFLFHGIIHLFLVGLLFVIFNLDLRGLVLVFLSSTLIDADHLSFIRKKGVDYWIKVWRSHIVKSFPLHNFLTIFIFSIGSLLIFDPEFFIIGVCSLSVTLHLLWDFIEDAFIFKMGISHWKV